MLAINDVVRLKAPFGDEITEYTITDAMGIDEDGAPSLTTGKETVYYQYLIGDCYYAEHFLIKAT